MYTKNDDVKKEVLSDKVSRKILSYSDNLMTVELDFKKDGVGDMHKHPHEQITYVISGKVKYKEDDKEFVMTAGDSYYVKPNALHGMVALEDSKILDIFTPMRKDFIKK